MSRRWLASLALPVLLVALALPALWQGPGPGSGTPTSPVAAASSGSGTSVEMAAAGHRVEGAPAPGQPAGTAAAGEERQRFFRLLLLYGAGARPFGAFK